MTAASMNYSTLVRDIKRYSERDETTFNEQIPHFINQAENRLASEARGLGYLRSVTDDLGVGRSDMAKPSRWRETVSFQIGTGTSYRTRRILLHRSYEFCREYWPDPTQKDTPKYYSDWDFNHWLIVPTPDFAYPFEVIYHERPTPLSASESTNWTTQNAPQLLLYACMLEACLFLKRDDRMGMWEAQYNRALAQLEHDQSRRMTDRTVSRNNDAG